MARVNEIDASALNKVIADIERLPYEMQSGVVDAALEAGGEVLAEAGRSAAISSVRRPDEATGQMANSIKPFKPKTSYAGGTIAIAPSGARRLEGKRKKAIRNAEVAFVHHYGTSKTPATNFFAKAADAAADEAVEAAANIIMTKIDEILGG